MSSKTAPKHPDLIPVDESKIPETLKGFRRWVVWKWIWKPKKNGGKGGWDKPPFNPNNGQIGSSTDPSAWSDLATALKRVRSGQFHGLGFALGKDEESGLTFSGFDLDDCIVNGSIDSAALFLASLLPSYTEISPSGEGLKVFAIGAFPPGDRVCRERHFEIYDSGHYFTITTSHLEGTPADVVPCQQELVALYEQLFPPHNCPPGRIRLPPREIALSALASIDTSLAAGYESWLAVGMALKDVSEDLLPDWDRWSQYAPDKYSPGECDKKWASFKRSGVSIGTLIHFAKQNGWVETYRDGTPYKSNGHACPPDTMHDTSPTPPPDKNMGDGLTPEPGAGIWTLKMETGKGGRFLLRSPLWENSPLLPDGFIIITAKQLLHWESVRLAAIAQTGLYIRPDSRKTPNWDGRGGRRLLRRLLAYINIESPSTDRDPVLIAAEFVIEQARLLTPVLDEKIAETKPRGLMLMENGDILFRSTNIASIAKFESPSITYEDICDAAEQFGSETYRRFGPKVRYRCQVFTSEQVERIEAEITRRVPPRTVTELARL